ncbi:DUF3443 domain-containing protein [Paraburkholderia phymatum]|uniref:Lipoprotein n=1 Tax=Paraburkholderia phymatum (strain DSM 17167 / CIP 108236 / LMG 21445 / STM815) TaxID=391038 RepID=B2JJ33_PARP8|nr:DUF3443 domain-containing protein [Paraburkholderia phymatum]ACC72135.1 conserved hypothetical protein [Paraburkholderia phymatum STM815]
MQFAFKLGAGVRVVKAVLAVSLVAVTAFVAGCGGGGDSSSSSSNNSNSGPNQQPIAANAANTVAVTVGRGVKGIINIPTVSVTVCAPNSSNCTTIDNVLLDTGSYGLRIVNSSAVAALGLTPLTATAGGQLAECTHFADGFTWGTVRTATVKVSGETANNIPIQVIGDMADSTVPSTGCINGSNESTADALGANGILGIGVAPVDCGSACSDPANVAQFSNYYACPNGTNCTRTQAETPKQVANPVPKFATDNNGVIVQMAPISANGAASATGTVVFGIGTQSNNANAAGTTYTTDASGDFPARGQSDTVFLDSGSNGYFFQDSSIPVCGGNLSDFYCPTSTVQRTVNLLGANGAKGTATINIANAQTLLSNASNYAFNDLGGQVSSLTGTDLGLPFFYGRYVYYGMDRSALPGGSGPFVAF